LLVALIWLFILAVKGGRTIHRLGLGVVLALCCYFDPYFILLAITVAAPTTLVWITASIFSVRRNRLSQKAFVANLKGLILAFLAFVVFITPLAVLRIKESALINSTTSAVRGDVFVAAQQCSNYPLDYILPDPLNVHLTKILGPVYLRTNVKLRHWCGLGESRVSISLVALGLVAIGLIVMIWEKINRRKIDLRLPLPTNMVLGVLYSIALTALLLGLPPRIGGRLMPSGYILQITETWRIFAREYVVLNLAVVSIFSLSLHYFADVIPKRARTLLYLLCFCLIIAEYQINPPFQPPVFSYGRDVPVYTWQLAGQYAFNDQTLTIPKSLVNLEPGERVYMGVQALNTGNTTWTRDGANPVHIGISNPYDRYSPYFDSTWIGQNRPGRLKEQSVSPGQIGTFEFWMTAPYSKSGVILEYLNLVVEGRTWMNNIGLNFYTSVKAPSLAWNVIEQYAYTDESKNSVVNLFALQPGQRVYVGVKALNSSNITWKNASRNPVRLATTRQRNRASLFCDLSSWINCSRPSTHLETDVPPGQIGTFEFWMTAPHTSGVSQEYYSLVSEGYEWFNDPGLHFNLRVIQQ